MNTTQYGVRGVLAGAYKESNPKSYLRHVCEFGADGFATRVLCSRVKLDNICDDMYDGCASEDLSTATCPVCAKRYAKEIK
jgi:hypothetical protein